MTIHEATYDDLNRIARLLAAAFVHAPIMGLYLHPYSQQYPEGIYLWFLRKLRLAFAQGPPDDRLLVSYDADSRSDEPAITGFAHWHRKRAVPRQRSLYHNITVKATEVYNQLEALIWPNRAIELSRAEKLKQSGLLIEHYWSASRAESWYLDLLAVDPAYGGKGYGRELVAWGFEQAKRDGVGCSVMAAAAKTTFYRACGFDVETCNITEEGGDANPLAHEDMPGGVVMFWDNDRNA